MSSLALDVHQSLADLLVFTDSFSTFLNLRLSPSLSSYFSSPSTPTSDSPASSTPPTRSDSYLSTSASRSPTSGFRTATSGYSLTALAPCSTSRRSEFRGFASLSPFGHLLIGSLFNRHQHLIHAVPTGHYYRKREGPSPNGEPAWVPEFEVRSPSLCSSQCLTLLSFSRWSSLLFLFIVERYNRLLPLPRNRRCPRLPPRRARRRGKDH